jgi:hypothetical protein
MITLRKRILSPTLRQSVLWILFLIICCAGIYLSPLFLYNAQRGWADLLAPHPREIHLEPPRLLADNLKDNSWQLNWSKDGEIILVESSNWTSATPDAEDTLSYFDASTGSPVTENFGQREFAERTHNVQIQSLRLREGHSVWAVCEERNLIISGSDFKGDVYDFEVWQATEQLAQFAFSSEQWQNSYRFPFVHHMFSPNCRYFTIVLWGDLGVDMRAQSEVWFFGYPQPFVSKNGYGEVVSLPGF